MKRSPVLDAALAYAARGWLVVPLMPRAKAPAGALAPHGLKDATADQAVIDRWWRKFPESNVGLVTGVAFDAIDIDPEGMGALVVEMPGYGPTINGPTVDTGRGTHCYVAPTGLGNRAGFLTGCDWRGKNGYVVAPPSIHPSGAVYDWHCGAEDPKFGIDAPIQPAPGWLLDLLRRRPEPSTFSVCNPRPRGDESAYGRQALLAECGRVALAPAGERNHTLNDAAFSLGQLVAAGVLDPYEVADALLTAAARAGLEEREARGTVASGLKGGIARPRTVAS